MPEITIRLHPVLAEQILAAGPHGGRSLSVLWRQAGRVIKSHGRHITYAPAILPDGLHCAMSIHASPRGVVIVVDRPGTLIPGRDVVVERRQPARRATPKER
ncbi:hypothetical protein [Rhodoblastus sp.]|uniref:hypothetical protein n=1 Tax=Rhodoblastus sp. TaxID=1962975 RepID=UPI003F9905A4